MPPRFVWFDHESDESGKPIRADVREAARQKWPQLVALARRRLGDRELEIQELFEEVVASTSSYLDQIHAPPQNPSGLLVVKFRQQLNALARRLERMVTSGSSRDIEPLVATVDWREEADRRIFLEELVRALSKHNRAVLRLRRAGYEWSEIAPMVSRNASTVRNDFWREIRKVCAELTGLRSDGVSEEEEQ